MSQETSPVSADHGTAAQRMAPSESLRTKSWSLCCVVCKGETPPPAVPVTTLRTSGIVTSAASASNARVAHAAAQLRRAIGPRIAHRQESPLPVFQGVFFGLFSDTCTCRTPFYWSFYWRPDGVLRKTISGAFYMCLSVFCTAEPPDFGRLLVHIPERRKTRNQKSIVSFRVISAALKSLVKCIGKQPKKYPLEDRKR